MHTDKLKYKELTRLIIKNFYQVYKELGGGFPGISLFSRSHALRGNLVKSNLFNLC
ncbi:MAG: hypothetical protein Q7U66_14950 [Methylobacter sp.]|nr:hypothetical protein [Methylobacter sp.]